MILAASTSEALTEGGLARAAAVFIPVLSVFLGMLFTMRYRNFYERLDELMQDAGVECLTESQKQHL
ncbi:MAG: hypothetical protein KDB07_03960, partial [Planctomycetes bacterium]|nr:hypothetical protein [Planctomycetota bacterium]